MIKIYYQIFRLKNHEFIKNNKLKEHSAIFFIILLSLLLIFSNLLGDKRANALETHISHTIISDIIPQDFSGQNTEEEFIEEEMDLNSILIAEKNNYNNEDSLKKTIVLAGSKEKEENKIIDDEDVIQKPKTIALNLSNNSSSPATRQKPIEYVVKRGDTVSTIARKFGLKVNTILWANNLSSFSLIRPGDKLTILPKNGILYTVRRGDTLASIAKRFSVTTQSIIENNNLGSVLKIGEELFLAGGKKSTYTRRTRKTYTGITAIKNLVKPANKKVTSSNKMAWPTVGHRITQYFSWRHSGLDIANKIGTPLYAADAGKVVYSGWSRGYGYNVVIDHGGGRKTRYAHASKLYVKVGDVVKKGETIAAMGSTGWSTGPHIHFEVIINGKRYNPLNYIK